MTRHSQAILGYIDSVRKSNLTYYRFLLHDKPSNYDKGYIAAIKFNLYMLRRLKKAIRPCLELIEMGEK